MKLFARLAIVLSFAAGFSIASPAAEHAAPKSGEKKAPAKEDEAKKPAAKKPEKKKTEGEADAEGKIGYSDTEIQLAGMMVPYATREGTNYEVLTIRLQLAPGETERPACWMAPIVAEKFLMYLHGAKLQDGDLSGQKRELLIKNLLDVAIKATDRSFYSGVMLVDETSPELAQKSKTLSSQCK